jgi:ribonuclease G
MTKELVISADRHETKVAVLEDDQLVEIYFQRSQEYSLAGSVHKGRVTRVLPGMQSAFVDLGLERDTFLYVSDFFEESDEYEKLPAAEEKAQRRQGQARALPPPPRQIEEVAPKQKSEAAASAPASPDRSGPRGEDDRRGRRGRRRRTRGRDGFPGAKYAEPRQAAAPQSVAEPAGEESLPEAEDFAVLPGESLAKYTRESGPPPGEEAAFDDEIFEGEPAAEPALENSREDMAIAEPGFPGAEDPADGGIGRSAEMFSSGPGEETGVADEEGEQNLTEEILDQIQRQAEAFAAGNFDAEAVPLTPVMEAAGLARPPAQDGEIAEPAVDESGELTEAVDADAAADEPAEESAVTQLEQEVTGPEPPLASMESMASSHREQTSRFMRGRRMRRRRGGQEKDQIQTVPPRDREKQNKEAPKEKPAAQEKPQTREGSESKDVARQTAKPASISELLKEGQEIVVQIAKEPLGQKGARITSHIALPGRYCVYMPTVEHLGVSRKIASDEERHRLRRILQTHREGMPGGFIIRTAGEGKTEEQIAADIRYLSELWTEIKDKADRQKAPALLYHDVEIVQRLLRDQFTENFKAVWVDNAEVYENVTRFVHRMQPSMVSRIKLYTRSTPIFDAFNITNELEKALRPKVWLKSGGYIVINQTEALVAIDVNTGKFVGKSNRLEDTIVKTNTDAVKEIVRQIRLRDLGGIIVVDFIDMDERKNRQKVMQALDEAMRVDRAPYKILQFNDFGLVAITRKRVKQSLERALCSPCLTCEGSGYTKSVQTVIGEILVEAHKLSPQIEDKEVMLRVHSSVAVVLKSKNNDYLEELEEIFKRPVLVTGDDSLHPEKFDLV